jgi:hypothetical protein
MIPLLWFLIAWLILIGLFALATLITVVMNLRYGLSGFMTMVTTGIFLLVVVGVLLASGSYLLTVDWSQSFDLFGTGPSLDL